MKMFLSLLFIFTLLSVQAIPQKIEFDKVAFYRAIASNNLEEVNLQLNLIKKSPFQEKEAYEGAMLMKKAGLVTRAKEKLSLFKSGRLKLEACINKEDSPEFSFLRLIIQEHAPKIVDYKQNIQGDVAKIKSGFKTLTPVVQQAITDYSKKSKVLKPL